MSDGERRPSFIEVWRNFRDYDAPATAKARMLLANSFRRIRHRTNCCGNGGQPGC